ncbi:MAG: HdeD family acid-resistance protein [Bryobacteraceae bacterium]
MSQTTNNPLIAGINEIRGSWGWFLFLGILFIALGTACIAFNITATFTTVLVVGWLLLIGGGVALIQSFTTGTWGGFFLYLLTALLRGFTGYLLVRYPLMGAETLTVVLASFFIVGGLFRAIGSGMAKFPSWGWAVFSGVVSVALGVMVLWQMPITGLWFIGLAVGVDLIVDGVAVTSFATAIHHLPKVPVFEAA